MKYEMRMIELIRRGKFKSLTSVASRFFGGVVRIRHWLYDHGLFIQKHAPLPVVSIGNLVVGGVGKTQVALLLAKSLENVAILTRGFRGAAEKSKSPLVVSTKQHTSTQCGDEPWLLASRLPKTSVIVNRNRYLSSLEAKKLGAKVLLLDDGMQHRQLFRNIEIVVLGSLDPLGGGSFLPRGFLREDPKRLKKADLVVFVGEPTKKVRDKITSLTPAPQVSTQICVKAIYRLSGEEIASLKGKKVGIFCGIANPARFVKSMQDLGASVIASHYLPDHAVMSEKEIRAFAALCKKQGAEYLFCTEKDKVKLSKNIVSPLPIGWVEVELEIKHNHAAWNRMTNEINILAGMSA